MTLNILNLKSILGDTIKSRAADIAAAAAVNGVANPNEEPMDTSESTTQNPASTDQSVPNLDDDDGYKYFLNLLINRNLLNLNSCRRL